MVLKATRNGNKSNFNQKKIDKYLAYLKEKTNQYLDELEQNDQSDSSINSIKIAEKIDGLKKNKISYINTRSKTTKKCSYHGTLLSFQRKMRFKDRWNISRIYILY
jgi:hypothetical protein